MSTLISVIAVVHIVNAILMAWPYYALVTVNQRARLGPPLGDRTDAYMENIIKNRTIPCFVFQITALVTGLALIFLRGHGLDILLTNAVLGLKFVLLVFIIVLLLYVHFSLQPRIDRLFAEAGDAVSDELAARIAALRVRRKRTALICMFVVLTIATLGMQTWEFFPVWLTVLLVIAIALFTWRAYTSETPYGWV
ncbi:MAG: hypothetical protein ACE5LF_01515 [Alphaproteobacteria bacterium]